jgi:lipoprotein signal peptidase
VIWFGVFCLFLDLTLQVLGRVFLFGVVNEGFSFGLSFGGRNGLPILIYILFVSWSIFEIKKQPEIRSKTILIMTGATGNIVSRLIWGSVWDYLCVPLIPFCFNLSDMLISLGIVSYILGVNANTDSI